MLTKGLAILGFALAFLTLVARERKSPYTINSIYRTVALVVVGLVLDVLSDLLVDISDIAFAGVSVAAKVLLFSAAISLIFDIASIYNQQVHFRDDPGYKVLKNSAFMRKRKAARRLRNPQPTYEHTAKRMPATLAAELKALTFLDPAVVEEAERRTADTSDQIRLSASLAYVATAIKNVDAKLLSIAGAFLKNGCPVQFITCIRHPAEFLVQLRTWWKENGQSDWSEVNKRVIVVDAFTPHFGFTDSIHEEFEYRVKKEFGVYVARSPRSYAGLHTSAAWAFNRIRKQYEVEGRPFTLVIYEGCHALVDLESVERYRLFLRHVFPSERVWGGMLTVFAEIGIPDAEQRLLRSYADLFIQDDDPSTRSGAES